MYKVLKSDKNQKLDFPHIKSYGKLKWRALSQIATNRAQIWDLSSVGQGDYALKVQVNAGLAHILARKYVGVAVMPRATCNQTVHPQT